ncbi:unnamed protein product [Linum trigynum]|uniref:Uncharacterized protein n=1 Tax=Linum trigynum TaxID=586398 RepID=A0AAV2F7U3_9ROSI
MWRDALASLLEFFHFVELRLFSFFEGLLQAAIADRGHQRDHKSSLARYADSLFPDSKATTSTEPRPSPSNLARSSGRTGNSRTAGALKRGRLSSWASESNTEQVQSMKKRRITTHSKPWRFKLPSVSELEWVEGDVTQNPSERKEMAPEDVVDSWASHSSSDLRPRGEARSSLTEVSTAGPDTDPSLRVATTLLAIAIARKLVISGNLNNLENIKGKQKNGVHGGAISTHDPMETSVLGGSIQFRPALPAGKAIGLRTPMTDNAVITPDFPRLPDTGYGWNFVLLRSLRGKSSKSTNSKWKQKPDISERFGLPLSLGLLLPLGHCDLASYLRRASSHAETAHSRKQNQLPVTKQLKVPGVQVVISGILTVKGGGIELLLSHDFIVSHRLVFLFSRYPWTLSNPPLLIVNDDTMTVYSPL